MTAVALVLPATTGIAKASDKKLVIQRMSPVKGMTATSFVVLPFERRVLTTSNNMRGYRPNLGGLKARWSGPLKMTWDFGDGSAPVSTGSHISAMHRYKKPGSYELKVSAADTEGVYAQGRLMVNVKPEPPNAKFRAVQTSDGLSMLFTGADVTWPRSKAYKLHLAWDFGDGTKRDGDDLWRVSHRYKNPGSYKVRLTATDGNGESRRHKQTIRVVGADNAQLASQPEPSGPIEIPEVVVNEFKGSVTGAVNKTLNLTTAPIAKTPFYLVQKNEGCDVKFSLRDGQDKIVARVSFRLYRFDADGGEYQITNPKVAIDFQSAPKHFKRGAGQLKVRVQPGQYIVGEINQKLQYFKSRKPKNKLITLTGKFSINLQEQVNVSPLIQQPGDSEAESHAKRKIWKHIQRAGQCADTTFAIKKKWPEDLSKHLYQDRPGIRADFTAPLDIDTVTPETVQVGYPNAENKFVTVKGRIVISSQRASFVPNESLLPGVTYQVRIKAGEDGVRSKSGEVLSPTDGSQWHGWSFTTALDFSATGDGSVGLACHVFQAIRDPLLIVGKPAVIRVYAKWRPHKNVHPSAQVKSFATNVIAKSERKTIVSAKSIFFRSDLYEANRISIKNAEHTTQLYFTPQASQYPTINVWLAVKRTQGGKEHSTHKYTTRCQMKTWVVSPVVKVDVHVLGKDIHRPNVEPVSIGEAQQFTNAAREYALQLLPVKDIQFSAPQRLKELPDIGFAMPPEGYMVGFKGMNGHDFPGFISLLRSTSKADIVVILGSKTALQLQARADGNIFQDSVPVIYISAPDATDLAEKDTRRPFAQDTNIYERLVVGLVHEIGHALGLPHVPYIVTTSDQTLTSDARFDGKRFWFQGIEGFRQNGEKGWNKSSTEGNSQHEWVAPLMYPGQLTRDSAFIMNHHYRDLQQQLESRAIKNAK